MEHGGRDETRPPKGHRNLLGFALFSSVASERDDGDTQDDLIFPVYGSYRQCVDRHRLVNRIPNGSLLCRTETEVRCQAWPNRQQLDPIREARLPER